MDFLEDKTKEFLESKGHSDIRPEPNSKCTGPRHTFPDFSIGNRIAVECTRLVPGDYETNKISLRASISNMLARLRCPAMDRSYAISIYYDYPYDKAAMKAALKSYLLSLQATNQIPTTLVNIADGLSVDFFPLDRKKDALFLLAGVECNKEDCWLASALLDQCRDAFERKTPKAQISQGFNEYWLAVGSPLTIGIRDEVAEWLKIELGNCSPWSRLLLIDADKLSRSRILELGQ